MNKIIFLVFSVFLLCSFVNFDPRSSKETYIVKYKDSYSTFSMMENQRKPKEYIAEGLYEVEVNGDLEKEVSLLMQDRNVEYIEKNFRINLSFGPAPKPSDPILRDPAPQRPGKDKFVDNLWGMKKIKADIKWNENPGRKDILILVIDTGIDYNHEDLRHSVWRNPGEVPGNGIDDDRNGYIDDVVGYDFVNNDSLPFDDNEHGTHVAGTISARHNNRYGVVGVAPGVSVASCKFLDKKGGGNLADAIRCIEYGIKIGARVLNNSWGGPQYSKSLEDAIARAKDAGILFVAAAGNDKNDNDAKPSYPASYEVDNILAVAASDSSDNLASFSNYGKLSVHLAAPGVAILSSTPKNNYSPFNGTSMATPHVVGAAASMLSKDPSLRYEEIIEILMNTGDDSPALKDKTVSGRRINLQKALDAL